MQQKITCFTFPIFFFQSLSLFLLHLYLNFSFKHFAKFISIVCNIHPSHLPPSLTALMDAGEDEGGCGEGRGYQAPVVEANLCSQSSVHLSSITLHLRRLQDTPLPVSEDLTYVVLLFWLQLGRCVCVLKKQWNVATAIWPHLSVTGEKGKMGGGEFLRALAWVLERTFSIY